MEWSDICIGVQATAGNLSLEVFPRNEGYAWRVRRYIPPVGKGFGFWDTIAAGSANTELVAKLEAEKAAGL